MQEGIAGETTRVASRVVRAGVASYGVASCIAFVGIVDPELGVVENVERFHAELQVAGIFADEYSNYRGGQLPKATLWAQVAKRIGC